MQIEILFGDKPFVETNFPEDNSIRQGVEKMRELADMDFSDPDLNKAKKSKLIEAIQALNFLWEMEGGSDGQFGIKFL